MGEVIDQNALDKLMNKYGTISEKYEEMGRYAIEAKIAKICEGFKIDRSRLD